MTLGAFISSALAGVAANKLGRRMCLVLACVTCCVANIIMMTTTHIAALYVGRFVIGLANGYFMTFSQLYIQESSPARYRGVFLTGFQFFTSFVSNMRIFILQDTNSRAGHIDWDDCRLGYGRPTRQIRLSYSSWADLCRAILHHYHNAVHSRVSALVDPAGQI